MSDRPSTRRVPWLVAVAAGGAMAAAAIIWLSLRPSGSDALAGALPQTMHDSKPAAGTLSSPGRVTVKLTERSFHPWPPKAQVVGRAEPASNQEASSSPLGAIATATAEPAPPSAEELRKESLRTGDAFSPEDARVALLDPSVSSAIKLAMIDKLRTQPVDLAVPVLVAFLETPASAAGVYTKPTAIRALSTFKDPLSEEALSRLRRSSADERVRLTIDALQVKGTSK
jgi:hypothetical protein